MGEEDSGEKTEEPTPHKLREARKKGQVSKSKDITTIILLVTSFYTLNFLATYLWFKIGDFMVYVYQYIGVKFTINISGMLLMDSLWILLLTLGPIMAIVFVAAILIEILQVGFIFSFEPMMPQLSKINPISGAKKYIEMKQYVEFVKSLLKMAIIIYVVVAVIREEFFMVMISQKLSPWDVMIFTGSLVMKTITRVAIIYFFIGFLDFIYQRYEFVKSMKMTKKEIKDEYKRLEGDPLIKQRQREAQREMSQGRQMGAVPDADVVVTNPVHIALAIQYTPNAMRAPVLLAKGKRLIAESIKKIAKESNVPIVQDPALARAIYEQTEVRHEIPKEHYQAVAEILAFVYKIKKKRKWENL